MVRDKRIEIEIQYNKSLAEFCLVGGNASVVAFMQAQPATAPLLRPPTPRPSISLPPDCPPDSCPRDSYCMQPLHNGVGADNCKPGLECVIGKELCSLVGYVRGEKLCCKKESGEKNLVKKSWGTWIQFST